VRETIDPDTLDTLVGHHRRFLDFLERRVGSRAVAEELLQAAFVKGLERGGDIRDGESAIAWFYRLLRNALVDHWRRRGAERRALERQAAEAAQEAVSPPELEQAVCQCVYGLIPTLKDEYREILARVEMAGRSVGEVAAELGLTANNATVRLHRARRALRQRLEAVCGTCTEHACLDCTCGKP
jgi:RNA polymerase sigma-70 factor (ECF subfamily)